MAEQNQNQNSTSELAVRREKLATLVENGQDPFLVTKYDVSHHSGYIKAHFDEFEHTPEAGKEGKRVSIAGRMVSRRVMGKASFVHLLDDTGKMQLYVRRDDVGEDI